MISFDIELKLDQSMENPLLLFDQNDPFAKFHFDNLTQNPPEKLYHYTSGEALIEIIDSQYLFATERSYLNDPQEFSWGLKRLQATLNDNVMKNYSSDFVVQMNIALDELQNSKERLFVLSLSANPDLLSQWRAYADDGKGVAIGLDANVIRSRAGFHEFVWGSDNLEKMPKKFCFTYHLFPVVYSQSDLNDFQIKFLNAAHVYWENLNNLGISMSDVLLLFNHFIQYRIREFLLSFKNPGYKEECEWRIVTAASASSEKISYRYGPFGVTPYVKVNLSAKNDLPNFKLPITEIQVGPNSPIKKNPIGMEMYCGILQIPLKYSGIDYRT